MICAEGGCGVVGAVRGAGDGLGGDARRNWRQGDKRKRNGEERADLDDDLVGPGLGDALAVVEGVLLGLGVRGGLLFPDLRGRGRRGVLAPAEEAADLRGRGRARREREWWGSAWGAMARRSLQARGAHRAENVHLSEASGRVCDPDIRASLKSVNETPRALFRREARFNGVEDA